MRAARPCGLEEAVLLDRPAQALGDHERARGGRLRAAPPRTRRRRSGPGCPTRARPAARIAAHLGERARAGQVAVLVVDPLEAVEVEEDHRQRDAVALAALDLAAEVEVQVARVEQPREVVGDRELLGALEQDRVLDRDRARLDERQHAARGPVCVKRPAELVDDLEHADRAPARDERGAQDRARLELGLACRLAARSAGRARRRSRSPACRSAATQPATPSPIFTPEARRRPCPSRRAPLEDQLLLLLVDHQHRPGLGGDQLADLLHDRARSPCAARGSSWRS